MPPDLLPTRYERFKVQRITHLMQGIIRAIRVPLKQRIKLTRAISPSLGSLPTRTEIFAGYGLTLAAHSRPARTSFGSSTSELRRARCRVPIRTAQRSIAIAMTMILHPRMSAHIVRLAHFSALKTYFHWRTPGCQKTASTFWNPAAARRRSRPSRGAAISFDGLRGFRWHAQHRFFSRPIAPERDVNEIN